MIYSALIAGLVIGRAAATPFPFKPPQSKADPKTKLLSNLVGQSTAIRQLDGDYEPDISGYSLQFQKCQFMRQMTNEECDADVGTCLQTQRFAIFRLCENCSNCNYNYGEYLIDLDLFLESTVAYYQEDQEDYCNTCEEICQNDQQQAQGDDAAAAGDDAAEDGDERRRLDGNWNYNNIDCSSCAEECYKIENMEANGYMDATEFLECQNVYEDNYGNAYYAGPMCSSSGEKIKIGVFSDEMCSVPANVDIDDYLKDGDGVEIKLSHNLMKKVYTDSCISCIEPVEDDGNNGDDAAAAEVEVREVCQELYEQCAKCETEHGFDATYNFYDIYYWMAAQEESICTMINQLSNGVYDSAGEILLNGSSSTVNGSGTTGGQKFALTVFILATIGLAAFAASLHSKLTKGGSADLSQQGGAMA